MAVPGERGVFVLRGLSTSTGRGARLVEDPFEHRQGHRGVVPIEASEQQKTQVRKTTPWAFKGAPVRFEPTTYALKGPA